MSCKSSNSRPSTSISRPVSRATARSTLSRALAAMTITATDSFYRDHTWQLSRPAEGYQQPHRSSSDNSRPTNGRPSDGIGLSAWYERHDQRGAPVSTNPEFAAPRKLPSRTRQPSARALSALNQNNALPGTRTTAIGGSLTSSWPPTCHRAGSARQIERVRDCWRSRACCRPVP